MPKILIVEDEELLRDLFVDDFEFAGFEVISTNNGQAALEILRDESQTVDFILSDIRMPKSSGIDLLDELKNDPNLNVPIALISGYADIDESAAIAKGALRLFKKPFRSEELIDFVKSHL